MQVFPCLHERDNTTVFHGCIFYLHLKEVQKKEGKMLPQRNRLEEWLFVFLTNLGKFSSLNEKIKRKAETMWQIIAGVLKTTNQGSEIDSVHANCGRVCFCNQFNVRDCKQTLCRLHSAAISGSVFVHGSNFVAA